MALSLEKVGSGYCVIMEEVKARIETINEFVAQLKTTEDPTLYRRNIFIFEGAYLHLRKVCELVGLGMLLAHNHDRDVPQSVMKEWRSDKLLDHVAEINPDGFPKPVNFTGRDEDAHLVFLADVPPVFSGQDLKDLYYKCGDLLHVGSLKNVLRNHTRELDQGFLQDWCLKFVRGLSRHVLALPDSDQLLFVEMMTPEQQNVTCRIVSRTQ